MKWVKGFSIKLYEAKVSIPQTRTTHQVSKKKYSKLKFSNA
jgi:hypothetical protein